MDSETAKHAIEPFFSTKEHGEGTGLGLSMVDGLVAQLGGRLTIRSEPGHGTTVTLFLPQAGVPIHRQDQPSSGSFPLRKDRGTVLLIDDDELVRMGTADMLSELGFEVLEASNAQQGLDLIETGLPLTAVVTDHLMPGMTGAELAHKLRLEQPELPILIISGYQDIETVAPDIARLSKPFRHSQLSATIAAMLGESGPH